MMIPNLIGVLVMVPLIMKITKNFIDRKVKNKDVEPMLSYLDEIQTEHAEMVKNGEE
jgi:AGCS family alanine or glycine:cation symporter